MTAYSSLGMVKLSRTNFGFFIFTSLATAGAAALTVLATTVFLGADAFLAAGFGATLTAFAATVGAAFGALTGFADLAGVDICGAGAAGVEAGVEVVMAVFQ
ncbi:hypothetical protein D3C72_1959960 [compost metagenome]